MRELSADLSGSMLCTTSYRSIGVGVWEPGGLGDVGAPRGADGSKGKSEADGDGFERIGGSKGSCEFETSADSEGGVVCTCSAIVDDSISNHH